MKKINILGVNVSAISRNKAVEQINGYLKGDKARCIVTPNPEIILKAGQDEEYFYILNKADLALPDGIGLKFAALLMGVILPRTTGADITRDILAIAEKNKIRTAVLNWRGGLSSRAEIIKAVNKLYPRLELLVLDIEREWTTTVESELDIFKPGIVFVALGAPWQEKFIYHNLLKIPPVKLSIGVGGAFDFITKKIKRAPGLLRTLGLEWLWRLIKQPRRWQRIYTAIIVFPGKFFKWRFVNRFFYRSNTACLLYKKDSDEYKILILERQDQAGHWQLPQGGLDNESIQAAGSRELGEEINCHKLKFKSVFKNLYKYEFPEDKADKGRAFWGYKGQKQSLFIAEFQGQDKDIKVNYWEHTAWKWVDSERLAESVHPSRRAATRIFLEKFKEVIKK